MIKFNYLSMKNFLSYGAEPVIVQLDQPGTTLILGEDLDNTAQGVGANGVGKTVLINALTYGVYDKPISSISKDNLVNNINKKHMEVVVEFEKGGHTYLIRRVRKAKATAAGNFVELFEDGVDITLDSMANTNKYIEQIIGMPYELFVRIVVFSATNTSFLDLPVRSQNGPNQTDIIEELFDLKTLSEKATILKDQMRTKESLLKSDKQRIELLEKEHERHELQLKHAQERVEKWKTSNNAAIIKIQRQLDRVSKVDIEEQHRLHDETETLKEEVRQAAQNLHEVQKDKKTTTTDLKKAEKELAHLTDDKCPYCLQEYSESKSKVKPTKSSITKLKKRVVTLSDEEDQLDKLILELDEKLEVLEKQLTVSDIEELIDIKNKSEELERKIQELENTVNPYLEPLEELEEIELEDINYDQANELQNEVDHMKFLYKLLTNKNSYVRKVLLNKSLPFLNQRLQEYLTKLGMTHQVEFTHEMTASITQFGRILDFGNLSNGQRARVNLALSFAFRDVLQSLHDRVNICMFDEILDVGLDGPGVTAAARMLKRKARDENLSLYIISHRDEIDSAFDRTMTVQLEGGFSKIVYS